MENTIMINGNVANVNVKRVSTGEEFSFQCGVDDLPIVQKHYWVVANKSGRVECNYRRDGKMVKPSLHEELTGSRYVEFLNGDRMDFRRSNLQASSRKHFFRKIGQRLKGNPIYEHEHGVTMWTTDRHGNKVGQFLIDSESLPLVQEHTWHINNVSGYVQARTRGGRDNSRGIYLHRLLTGAEENDEVDHINRIKTDNRKVNLRICRHSENEHNLNVREDNGTGVTGVSFKPVCWWAKMRVDGRVMVKAFKSKESAIKQRQEWEDWYGDRYTSSTNKNNTTGIHGVHEVKSSWLAFIQIDGRMIRKTFPTFGQAVAQRKQWEEELNPSGLK